MAKERIRLEMTTMEVVLAMAEGNPGAIRVCTNLLRDADSIDPDAIMGGLGAIMGMDTLGIYASRIWQLYKDVCKQDLAMMLAVLRAFQLGQLAGVTKVALNHAIDHYGDGLDLSAIMVAMQERLPNFNVTPVQVPEEAN